MAAGAVERELGDDPHPRITDPLVQLLARAAALRVQHQRVSPDCPRLVLDCCHQPRGDPLPPGAAQHQHFLHFGAVQAVRLHRQHQLHTADDLLAVKGCQHNSLARADFPCDSLPERRRDARVQRRDEID
ncbi:MAG: hypothetical protein U0521_09200 [Anaerolineae bacterium]